MPNRSRWVRAAVAVVVLAAPALAMRAGGAGPMDTLRRLHGGH